MLLWAIQCIGNNDIICVLLGSSPFLAIIPWWKSYCTQHYFQTRSFKFRYLNFPTFKQAFHSTTKLRAVYADMVNYEHFRNSIVELSHTWRDSDRAFTLGTSNVKLCFSCGIYRETHLWYILPDEVKSSTLLNRYLELLSPCEKEKVFRMHGDQLQKRTLLARTLVRTTIARCRSSFA